MLTITYLLLCHGEPEIFPLIDYIREHKSDADKILVLNDPTTDEYFRQVKGKSNVINHVQGCDHSAHTNFGLDHVRTDYCFALDADERPSDELIDKLHDVLEKGQPDMVWVPRANFVDGMLPIHCLTSGWTMTEGMVNWPDPQTRIVRTGRGIRWVGKLHLRLRTGQNHRVMHLPYNPKCSIIHVKTMETQIKTNERYAQQFSPAENSGEDTMNALQ